MISKDELLDLESRLDYMHKQLSRRVDPAKRGNAQAILDDLQLVLAKPLAGQTSVQPGAKLENLIASFPLKTDALKISATDLAGFRTEEFEGWLGRLKQTLNRIETIKTKADWMDLTGGRTKEEYSFVLLADLP